MASELMYPVYSNFQFGTHTFLLDERASMITGVFGTDIQGQWYPENAYQVKMDDPTNPAIPAGLGTAFVMQPTLGGWAYFVNGATMAPRMRFTPNAQDVIGFVVFGDASTGRSGFYANYYVDGTLIDHNWRCGVEGTMPAMSYKGPMWGYVSSLGNVAGGTLNPSTHTLDIECPVNNSTPAGAQTLIFPLVVAVRQAYSQPDPHRILIIGDSFGNNNRSFVLRLRNLLLTHFRHSDLRIYTLVENGFSLGSYSGHTTASIESGTAHGLTALDIALLGYNPGIIINMMGENDVNFSANGSWGSDTRAACDTLLSKCNAYGAKLINLNAMDADYGQHAYSDGLRLWSARNGVPYFDFGNVIAQQASTTNGTTFFYNSHPSNGANAWIAWEFFRYFTEYLKWELA